MPFGATVVKGQNYWRTRKPPLGAQLDLGHSLAHGATGIFVMNEGSGEIYNLARPDIGRVVGGMRQIITSQGLAADCDGSATEYTFTSVFGFPSANAETTIVALVNLLSTSANGAFVKVGNDTAGIGLGVGNTTFDLAGNNLIGLYEGVVWKDTGVLIGTGWHQVALNVDLSNIARFFLDGKAGSFLGGATSSQALTSSFIGGYTAAGVSNRHPRCQIAAVWIYTRTLYASDILQLYLEPYSMLVVPAYRRFFLPLAASAVGGPSGHGPLIAGQRNRALQQV